MNLLQMLILSSPFEDQKVEDQKGWQNSSQYWTSTWRLPSIYIYVHEKKAQKQEVAYVTYKLEVSKKDTVGNLRIEAGWTQNCT